MNNYLPYLPLILVVVAIVGGWVRIKAKIEDLSKMFECLATKSDVENFVVRALNDLRIELLTAENVNLRRDHDLRATEDRETANEEERRGVIRRRKSSPHVVMED